MSLIKVADAVYARVAAPDLDEAEAFLSSIGLTRAARTPERLYMRGTDGNPFLHVTELGAPRFLGLGFRATRESDVESLARATRIDAETPDDPGGGLRVRLTDPNGFGVEVGYWRDAPPPSQALRLLTNCAHEPHRREGRGPWRPDHPPQAKRFGHAVLRTPRFEETVAWYQEHLGLRCSDQIVDGEGNVTGSFNRIDLDDGFVDHHVLLISKSNRCGWHHVSYEVQNWSEVFEAAAFIRKQGRYKLWRPPMRHFLGGQVGAYVADPWGRIFEFWSDGDRLNNRHQVSQWTTQDITEQGPDWDPAPLPGFRDVLSA